MKKAAKYKLILAGLAGCLMVSADIETAHAESTSMDAILQALAAESKLSLCTGSGKAAARTSQTTKMAGRSALSPARVGGSSTLIAPNSPSQDPAQMDHSHIPVEVPKSAPVPKLSTVLSRDVMSGYNLHIRTGNYDMSPPPVGVPMEDLMKPRTNSASGFVQGHAHLYINGEKIQRVYGNHIHIPTAHFKTGMNQLNITINNHAHMFWTTEEKQIISSLFIDTRSPKLVMHQFDSRPVKVGKF